MKAYRIILKPKSSVTSFPGSDTLFGAICWGIRTIYGENSNLGLRSILESFNSNPKFIISSSFPVLKNKHKEVYFYPKPIRNELTYDEIDEIAKRFKEKFNELKKSKVIIISEFKKIKKTNFVSQNIFNDIMNGKKEKFLYEEYLDGKIFNEKESNFNPEYLGGKIKLVKNMLMYDDEYKSIFDDGKRPKILEDTSIQKNSIDRISMTTTGEGQTFYSKELFLSPKLNLYFIIKTDDIDYLKPVFNYLEDTGIGKDRFTGKGNFKFSEPDEYSLPNIANGNYFVTLSRYIPKVDELFIDKEKMFYELLPYRSKVESIFEFKGEDIFKDKVIYIKEGSVFEAKERKEFYGLTPVIKRLQGKEILQYGLAFPIFLNTGE